MANVSSIIAQLKKERDRVERQLSGLNAALMVFAGLFAQTVAVWKANRLVLTSPPAKRGTGLLRLHGLHRAQIFPAG
jgi:hypothetical protein